SVAAPASEPKSEPEPVAAPAPAPAARPVEATLFDLEGTVSHRRRQRVILSLYGATGSEMPAPKPRSAAAPAAIPAEPEIPVAAEPALPVEEPAVVAEPAAAVVPAEAAVSAPVASAVAEPIAPEATRQPAADAKTESAADAMPNAEPLPDAEPESLAASDAEPVPFVEEFARAVEESAAEASEAAVETAVAAEEPAAVQSEPEPGPAPETVPEAAHETLPEAGTEPVAAGFAPSFGGEGAPAPVLGDVINHDVQTLADTIGRPRDVVSELRRLEPVTDLERAIGINDKFLLIRDLFCGDAAAYDEAIATLNGFDDLDDCMIHIAEHYAWNPNSDGAKLLMELLERKFA
ncbi:MAG: hypothetical protein K2I59_04325, partial [Alistipes sp.]|nr:hypothetical protein [Alistipes sp.]